MVFGGCLSRPLCGHPLQTDHLVNLKHFVWRGIEMRGADAPLCRNTPMGLCETTRYYKIQQMIRPGDVISYFDMCSQEGSSLQRGMNFHLHGNYSVILMSRRSNAPYSDKVENEGRTLIYEGHDVSKTLENPIPKNIDQPMYNPIGSLTQNGLFCNAAQVFKKKGNFAELVKVFEKIHPGIWVYNGTFKLVDAWQEQKDRRKVFKFKLELTREITFKKKPLQQVEQAHNRIIPSEVKLEVWKRDKGKCIICGSNKNLHFDHDLPFSKGGTSLTAKNIQLLCAKHNLSKGNKIQ
jgi:hypothetical protein